MCNASYISVSVNCMLVPIRPNDASIILRLVGNPGALSIKTSLIGKYQMLE